MKVKNPISQNIYICISLNDHLNSIHSGYLLFFETTIMGKTACNGPEDNPQRGSLLKGVAVQGVLYQSILNESWLVGRNWLGKCAQATGMTASLRILSSKADSNTWESFTRNELKLESVHQESPRSDIFRKRATKPLLKQKQCQKNLTWAKEKKNWTRAVAIEYFSNRVFYRKFHSMNRIRTIFFIIKYYKVIL